MTENIIAFMFPWRIVKLDDGWFSVDLRVTDVTIWEPIAKFKGELDAIFYFYKMISEEVKRRSVNANK